MKVVDVGWRCLMVMMVEDCDGLGVILAVVVLSQPYLSSFERMSSHWKRSCDNSMTLN